MNGLPDFRLKAKGMPFVRNPLPLVIEEELTFRKRKTFRSVLCLLRIIIEGIIGNHPIGITGL